MTLFKLYEHDYIASFLPRICSTRCLRHRQTSDLHQSDDRDAESGDEYDDDSIMPIILSKEEMYAMDSGDESDHDPISTEMLEDICDGSQSHQKINGREDC